MAELANIAAIVLAAGQSQRMGQPKMILPWGQTTVIGQVLNVLTEAGMKTIWVVTGGAESQVVEILSEYPVSIVHNSDYAQTEMLASLKCGLLKLNRTISAALVVLGDQPQIEKCIVDAVVAKYLNTQPALVVPSYQKRRGHPWLVERNLWGEIVEMSHDHTMRDFLNRHAGLIEYIDVDSPSILKDLDTPQDYAGERP